MRFEGFPAAAFAWFEGLERDNSKAYFTATRDEFQRTVRDALEAMLDELGATFGGEAKVFRQHRDLRFTPDRTPYKTRTYGVLSGRPGTHAALYAEVSARGLYAGTGYYGLGADQLDRFRAAVAAEETGPGLADAVAAARDAGLDVDGAALRTAPRGYSRDHPRVDLLRHKMLIAGRRVAPGAGGIPRAAALEHAAGSWQTAAPIVAWLDAHVGPSELELPGRT